MLYWNNVTMSWNQLLIGSACQVAACTHGNHGSFWGRVILPIAMNTAGHHLLCLRIVWVIVFSFIMNEKWWNQPLIANCLFIASLRIFLRPSFSALSSIYSKSSCIFPSKEANEKHNRPYLELSVRHDSFGKLTV
jgi:hypothetical protein